MKNKKQSSIDFIDAELQNNFLSLYPNELKRLDEIIKKARVMHKRELSKALDVGYAIANKDVEFKHIQTTEQYFNETFGGQYND